MNRKPSTFILVPNTEQMEFETPWDGLDLDLVPGPRPIPRLKLPAPSSYLSLLPSRKSHENWEERWSKANTASKMRAVVNECIGCERQIVDRIRMLKLSESPPDPDDRESTPQEKVSVPREKVSTAQETTTDDSGSKEKGAPSTAPTDCNHLLRKRARASNADDVLYCIPKAKRVRFKEFTEEELTEVDIPSSTPTGSEPDTSTGSIVEDWTPTADYDILDPTSSNNLDPTLSLVDLHGKVFGIVNAWDKLVLQAEGIEDNLYAIQSNSEATVSSLQQLDMSKEQLEEGLEQMQIEGTQIMTELDEAALSARKSVGPGSLPMTQFQAEDPGMTAEDYDLDIKMQLKEHGLFGWWVAGISGEL